MCKLFICKLLYNYKIMLYYFCFVYINGKIYKIFNHLINFLHLINIYLRKLSYTHKSIKIKDIKLKYLLVSKNNSFIIILTM